MRFVLDWCILGHVHVCISQCRGFNRKALMPGLFSSERVNCVPNFGTMLDFSAVKGLTVCQILETMLGFSAVKGLTVCLILETIWAFQQ